MTSLYQKSWTIVVLLIPIASTLNAQTNVSGLISTNTTWTPAGSPYIVKGNTLVFNGVTLTIEPGVVVQFDTTKTMQIDGELIAIGSAQERITFTASDPTPAHGSWGRIQFSHNSTDAVFDIAGNYVSGSIMKYCDIMYGGGVPGDITVFCDTSLPYFSHCRISYCLKHAIHFANSVGRVDSSTIRNCIGTAILFTNTTPADLIVMNDTLEDNGGGVVRAYGPGNFNRVTIQHCVFTRTGDAVDVVCWDSSIIRNNVFTENENAIRGDLGRNFATKAIISDNVFTGQTGSVIGRELCYDLRYSTLWGQNITVKNNYFEDNESAIILYARNNVIQDNTFLHNQFTLFYCYSPGEYLMRFYGEGGEMINNVFDGNTSPAGGTLVKFSGPWEISGNLIENNSNALFSLSGAASICSNKFVENTGAIIYSTGLSAVSEVRNNEFYNNAGAGAIVTATSSSIINNNEFRDNSSSIAIVSISNSNSNIHNNDFRNNTAPSCLRVSGNTVPQLAQNNFVNPAVQYEIENLLPFGPGANINMPDNYWGTTGTAHIDSVILDFFDDANLSVVFYSPVLASPAGIDTGALCAGDPVSLSGAILTEIGLPVPGVTVTLSGDDTQRDTTDALGRYSFTVGAGSSYTVTPSRNNDVVTNNGITSIDILLTRRHILGTPLSTPYKIIAADVEASSTVSTLDILHMRSMILQSITTFPNGRLWSFVPSSHVFADLLNPFPYPSTRTYTNLSQSLANQDFIGIKLGDVNDSWDGNIP